MTDRQQGGGFLDRVGKGARKLDVAGRSQVAIEDIIVAGAKKAFYVQWVDMVIEACSRGGVGQPLFEGGNKSSG